MTTKAQLRAAKAYAQRNPAKMRANSAKYYRDHSDEVKAKRKQKRITRRRKRAMLSELVKTVESNKKFQEGHDPEHKDLTYVYTNVYWSRELSARVGKIHNLAFHLRRKYRKTLTTPMQKAAIRLQGREYALVNLFGSELADQIFYRKKSKLPWNIQFMWPWPYPKYEYTPWLPFKERAKELSPEHKQMLKDAYTDLHEKFTEFIVVLKNERSFDHLRRKPIEQLIKQSNKILKMCEKQLAKYCQLDP